MKEKVVQYIRQMKNPRFLESSWPTEQMPELAPAPVPGGQNPFETQDVAQGIDMPDMGESTALAPEPFEPNAPFGEEMDKKKIMEQRIKNRLGERNGFEQ